MGQDPCRDFDTLIASDISFPVRIHTALRLSIPPSKKNVELTRGSYHNSSLTDLQLLDLYRESILVVVPLKDVYQPSGYSVTLQAMSCSKPVIITRTRGLWAPHLFVDGVNCLFVEPGNIHALSFAINQLLADKDLRIKLGSNGRKTVEEHFSCANAADSLEAIIEKL